MRMFSYTQETADTIRDRGNVTPNGIAYDYYLLSPRGSRYIIIDEGQPTKELKAAKDWIRYMYDTCGRVYTAKITQEVE